MGTGQFIIHDDTAVFGQQYRKATVRETQLHVALASQSAMQIREALQVSLNRSRPTRVTCRCKKYAREIGGHFKWFTEMAITVVPSEECESSRFFDEENRGHLILSRAAVPILDEALAALAEGKYDESYVLDSPIRIWIWSQGGP